MTSDIHVSTIVTLHREGKYLARTLRSLSEAARYAAESSIRTELVATFDRSDPLTRDVFGAADLSAFRNVRTLELDHGSVSLSRNAGCQAAAGEWLDMIDGDDLISYTSIARMYEAAQRTGPKSVLVPEFSFAFGAKYYTVQYFSQDDIPTFSTVKYSLYTSKIFYHRSLLDLVRYTHVPLGVGYAYEDWHFNTCAMAHGYRFVAVEGTALLYRQRHGSRNDTADQISARQIPPSPLFQPARFRRIFADAMARYGGAHAPELPTQRGLKVFSDPVYRKIVARANAIDPAVDIGHFEWDCLGHFSNAVPPEIGLTYYRLCEAVGDQTFDDVILLSGDAASASIALTLQQTAPDAPRRRVLALFDHIPTETVAIDSPQAEVTPLYLPALFPELSVGDRDLLCFKLMQASAGRARLHFGTCPFGRRFFTQFRSVLSGSETVCYRSADPTVKFPPAYYLVDGTVFQFLSENIASIDQVVCLDARAFRDDRIRMPHGTQTWVLRAPASIAAPAA